MEKESEIQFFNLDEELRDTDEDILPPLEKAIEEAGAGDLKALGAIMGRLTEEPYTDTEEAVLVSLIHKKFGIPKSTVWTELKKGRRAASTSTSDTNFKIIHPSYEVNEKFLVLGFRRKVLADDKPVDRNFYLVMEDGTPRIEEEETFKIGEIRAVPDLRERVLMDISERWSWADVEDFAFHPTAPATGACYREILRLLREHLEFQDEGQYGLIAAWIIATYFHRIFHAMPFVSFYGKKQSGKSRALDFIERLAFNAMKTKGCSVPSLADSVDGVRATFMMDQSEMLSDRRNQELLGILADSYTTGGGKRRIVSITQKARKVLEFETYGPKAFASIREMDTDLRDRCILVVMLRGRREFPYPEAHLPVWGRLREMLYRLLLTRWRVARGMYAAAGGDMKQRVRELWRPIETVLVLENVPVEECRTIEAAFLRSMEETQTGLSEMEEKLIEAVRVVLGDRERAEIFTSDIAARMDVKDISEKALETRIGTMLRRLCIYDERLPKRNGKRPYTFTRDRVSDVLSRFSNISTSMEKVVQGGEVVKDVESREDKGEPRLETDEDKVVEVVQRGGVEPRLGGFELSGGRS